MRDLLTREECNALWAEHDDLDDQLQAAARLGAERERERCAKVCDEIGTVYHDAVSIKCAAAIRRGEGE